MKDLIHGNESDIKVSALLGTIKERLVEYRFNIDEYDHKKGRLKARRNSLDKIISGLYRNIEVEIRKDEKTKEMDIELRWGGLLVTNILTFIFTFLVSYAIFQGQGTMGFLLSIPVGLVAVILNLVLFFVMRLRLTSTIRKDIMDLERAEKKKKGRSRYRN